MFVPIILGSDKTTVSVATGHTEYWPIYGSIGNIHNNIRHAHGAGLVLIGFLLIPKSKSQLLFFSAIFSSILLQLTRHMQEVLNFANFVASFSILQFLLF